MAETAVATQPAFGEATTRDFPWWLMLIEGLAAIVLGVFLFTNPAATTVTIVWFIAMYWIVTGILSIVSLVWDRTQWGWRLAWGIISILAGWFIVTDLLVGTAALLFIYVIILAVQGIMLGIVQVVQATRGAGWGRGVLGGLSIVFGLLLLAWNWKVVLVLPWVFGVFAVAGGLLAVVGSFMLRSAQKAA
jgi:uncharacterized membrane protein HdeD (DUF308 family)